MSGPIASQRFTIALNDRGNAITRSVCTESNAISTLCFGTVADERNRFCAVWRDAVTP
jgi:hypothetical protein